MSGASEGIGAVGASWKSVLDANVSDLAGLRDRQGAEQFWHQELKFRQSVAPCNGDDDRDVEFGNVLLKCQVPISRDECFVLT